MVNREKMGMTIPKKEIVNGIDEGTKEYELSKEPEKYNQRELERLIEDPGKDDVLDREVIVDASLDVHYNKDNEEIYKQVWENSHEPIYNGWGAHYFIDDEIIYCIDNDGSVSALPRSISKELNKERWAMYEAETNYPEFPVTSEDLGKVLREKFAEIPKEKVKLVLKDENGRVMIDRK